jgi:hypothetical protein
MDTSSTAFGWYVNRVGPGGSNPGGPLSWDELWTLARSGGLGPGDLVWHPALGEWTPAERVAGLLPADALGHFAASSSFAPDGRPRARRYSWLRWAIPAAVVVLVAAGLGIYFGIPGGTKGIDSYITVQGVHLKIVSVEFLYAYSTGGSTLEPESGNDAVVVVEGEAKSGSADASVWPDLTDENGRTSEVEYTERVIPDPGETAQLTWVFFANRSAKSLVLNLPDGQTIPLESLQSR